MNGTVNETIPDTTYKQRRTAIVVLSIIITGLIALLSYASFMH